MAPFGRPVVPDVNMMLATSPGSTDAALASLSGVDTPAARSRNEPHDVVPVGDEPRRTMTSSSVDGRPTPSSNAT